MILKATVVLVWNAKRLLDEAVVGGWVETSNESTHKWVRWGASDPLIRWGGAHMSISQELPFFSAELGERGGPWRYFFDAHDYPAEKQHLIDIYLFFLSMIIDKQQLSL